MLGGVARYLREHDPWSIYLKPVGVENSLRRWVENWRGDGIIVALKASDTDLPRDCKIPLVDVAGLLERADVPLVHANDHAIGRVGAEHLLDRGFRNFGFVEYRSYAWSANRRLGFEQTVRAAGYDVLTHVLPLPGGGGPAFWEQQQSHLATWIGRLPKPAGVMTSTDLCGQQLLEACQRIGIAVPEEVAVIGADNDELICSIANPALSSVMINDEQRGYEAAAMLDRLMSGEPLPFPAVYIEPSGAVSRASTDVLAIDDDPLSAALRFVRDQACTGITVRDILRVVRVSRSALTDLFVNPTPPLASLKLNRLGTPHRKGTMMNVVFADGHVALIDPRRDLFANRTQVFSARYYLWGEPKISGTGATVAGWPNAANTRTDPPGLGYWKKDAPGL